MPPWALGALTAGIIVKKLSPKVQGSAVMGVVSAVLSCSIAVALMFVGCENPPFAGVTVGYQGKECVYFTSRSFSMSKKNLILPQGFLFSSLKLPLLI